MVETHKEMEETKNSYMAYGLFEQDAIYKGRKEGREEAKLEAARNLLIMGILTHEQIAQAEGLTVETVDCLAQELAIGQA